MSYGKFRNFLILLPEAKLREADPSIAWFEAATTVPFGERTWNLQLCNYSVIPARQPGTLGVCLNPKGVWHKCRFLNYPRVDMRPAKYLSGRTPGPYMMDNVYCSLLRVVFAYHCCHSCDVFWWPATTLEACSCCGWDTVKLSFLFSEPVRNKLSGAGWVAMGAEPLATSAPRLSDHVA